MAVPPPSEDCAPKKLTGSVLLECKSSPETPKILLITLKFVSKNCFFVDFAMNTDCFCGLTPEIMKLRVYFGTKTLILFYFLLFTSEFVEIRTIFEMENRICENAGTFSDEDFVFFFSYLRMRGYSRWTLFSLSPHSRIQINKVLVPPQSRYPGARPTHIFSELEILLINYYVLERQKSCG